MGKPRLIGLWAPAMRSGKTTIAEMLVLDHGFFLRSFAGPLKEMTRCLLEEAAISGGDDAWEYVWGSLKEVPLVALNGITPRRLMQTLGTEWGRDAVHEDFWVDIATSVVQGLHSQGRRVVFDDMRFPNEAQRIKDLGGICVKVERPGVEVTEQHSSEGALADWDFDMTITNDGSLEDLRHKVRVWMSMYR